MSAENDSQRLYQFIRYAAIAAVFALLGYFGGNARLHHLEQNTRLQESQRSSLHQRVERLEYRNNILQVELDVERAATRALQQELREAIDQNAQIRRDLVFYQRVMAPELDADGVSIDSFQISRLSNEERYYFRLILLQLERIEQLMTGSMRVVVRGQRDGQRQDLSILELAGYDTEHSFSMSYFTLTEGSFSFPEGFTPDTVHVHVRVRGGRQTERYFPWSDLLEASDLEHSPES
ncbi:hypothetical protein FM042_10930 [Aliidiomarina halalkaliphila]|uniref:DUF3450 domain-containing protein n=1 Tax=Aliidiomarina halalkaliphila TaxID=2593535 RepID=A0A552WZB5_9GAMM|nr:DUF6776 family protein [Aliidiomarina halalkaliphila]TRW48161.1 hypothetical protein FM042_10930 [Aliidiomarina halalkaliphila]